MEKILKSTKVSIAVIAILSLGLGIVLLLYPQITISAICYAFGGVLIACAAFHVFFYFRNKKENRFVTFNLVIAILTGVLGIWIITTPSLITRIVPIIFGIVLVIYGMVHVKLAFELKEKYYSYWWVALILVAINFLLASLLFLDPFQASSTLILAIGISLIYNGISSLWILSRISKAQREIKKSLNTINEAYIDEKL
jgi:uncharacterized membrane protein HdeD (DUF308 family)